MESNLICSYNVRGLADIKKRQQVFQWLRDKKFSICLLQETHLPANKSEKWKSDWGNDAFFSGINTNSEGVAILINNTSTCKIIHFEEIIPGRLIALEINVNEFEILLINIYGPNTDNTTIFDALENYTYKHNDKNIIIGGDFNTVINPQKDKKNGKRETHLKCRTTLNNIISSNELVDIWRKLNTNKNEYTWHSNTIPKIFCRLDFFLVSESISNKINRSEIIPSFKSDHSIVYIQLNCVDIKRGPGYFKINNSLLLETDYQNKIKESIENIARINNGANPNTLWEIIKGEIRNQTIKYSTFKNKMSKIEEENLIKEIKIIENNLNENRNVAENKTIYTLKKEQLDKLYEKKVNGHLLRARALNVELNEKNTKYFANLEKRHAEKKSITKLVVESKEITNFSEIMSEQFKFYKNIYSSKTLNTSNINFFKENMQKLNDENSTKCEGKITEDECRLAINEMKNNKSPGSDGLTVEFYKQFWPELKDYYVNSINYSFEKGELTELQKQGIITLLPKPGKDLNELSNWRPISLLNVDYKIVTKAIANRIKKVLPNLISEEQTGFLKGRYIGENVRLIFETIEYVQQKHLPCLLFFADFERAFDCLNHEFIFKCLKHLNFGTSLIQWIKLFYKSAQSSIINNGHFTDFFAIERGVRQGCPLSTSLFIICVQFLSHTISMDEGIKGIKVNKKEIKQTLFADDATFINNGEKGSFEKLIHVISDFENVSGLRLNTKKSTVLRIGTLNKTNIILAKDKKFIWTSTQAKTLGMTFCNDYQQNIKNNMEPKLQEFKNCLKQWEHRKLTLLGKITVIKTFALPKLIYPFTVLENPSDNHIADIKSSIFKFLWDNKPDKIKRTELTKSYEEGGLKLTNIDSFLTSIKACWVKRLLNDDNKGLWKCFYENILKKCGGNLIFECNLDTPDIKNISKNNFFLKDVLLAWRSVIKCSQLDKNHKEMHIIWNNSDIRIDNKPFFHYEMYSKGIKFVEQLYDFRNKHFYSFIEAKHLFNLHNRVFLEYYKTISSIPNKYIKILDQTILNRNIKAHMVEKIKKCKNPNKIFYNILQNSETQNETTKSEEKWNTILSKEDIRWKSVYILPFLSTIDTVIRNFQYKYLKRIIPTNKYLYKCKLTNSELCDFCNMHVETQEHLFWECQHAQNFWTKLNSFLREREVNITWNLENISFGIKPKTVIDSSINYIILLGKIYIFKMKYQNCIPNIENFKYYLQTKINIEKEIAFLKNKLDVHQTKWSLFNL
jgi:exonuclease III